MKELFFDEALLPTGWASAVGFSIEDGTIQKVETGAQPVGRERVPGVAFPGLPNLHSHSFQRGMAGLSECRGPDEDSFWSWRQTMYRFLSHLTPDDIEAIAAFAFLEMLEGGFTAVGEFHYLHHGTDGQPYTDLAELSGRIANSAVETGIGLTLLPAFYSSAGFGGIAPAEAQKRFINDPARFAKLFEAARNVLAGVPDHALGIAPHSLRAVTPDALSEVIALAPDGPIHIHAAEQLKEVEDCLAWSGRRPIEWLLEHAPLDSRWCVVHATHMTPEERHSLAKTGAVVGVCPLTEANLGDGIFEGRDFLIEGGIFGVGSDSNVEISAPAELKQLEYSQRLKLRTRNVLAPRLGGSTGRRLYEGALAGGQQALGRQIGALAEGYRADIVVLNSAHPEVLTNVADRWLDSYIFVGGKSLIDAVFVGGRQVVSGGKHYRRDEVAARYIATVSRLAAQ